MLSVPCAELTRGQEAIDSKLGQTLRISGRVVEDPRIKKGSMCVILNEIAIDGDSSLAEKNRIYVIMSVRSPTLHRSDQVVLLAKITPGFGDYSASIYYPKLIKRRRPHPKDYANEIKEEFTTSLRAIIGKNEQSGLALAYLLGDKSTISEEFVVALRRVGLVHLVVASGFHLSILLSFTKNRLQRYSRAGAVLGSVLVIFIFLAIAGFTPSLARAAIMSILALYAWYYGRRLHPGRGLLFAVAISLGFNPGYLKSLAWQLSFLAYSGIVLFSPVLVRYFYGPRRPSAFASLLIQSISAQLFCAPLLIYSFGELAVLGIISNIIISPSISIVMALSVLSAFVYRVGVASFIVNVLAFFLYLFLKFHTTFIEFLAQFPWLSFKLEKECSYYFLAYIPLFLIWLYLYRKTKFHYRPYHPELANNEKYGKIYTC